jgi:hypothetical protein
MKMSLKDESRKATEMLKGKVVAEVWRHRKSEVGIKFTDGTRFFIDQTPDGLDLSITEDSI